MPGFRRKRIEEAIIWWSPSSIRVRVRLPGGRREGDSFQLPQGYVPTVRGDNVILSGAGAPVLELARRQRDQILGRRNRIDSGLPDAEAAARTVTLSEVYDLLLTRTAARRRPDTVRSYRNWRPRIEAAFGHLPLVAIRPPMIESWLDRQLLEVSPCTAGHYRKTLIRLFNVATAAELYPYANPAAKTEPILVEEKERRRLSEPEIVALLDACRRVDPDGETTERRPDLWYAFFATLLFTGLRFREGAELRWEDFRWELGLCVPNHQKARRRKDAIVITPEWTAVLSLVRPPLAEGLVFPSATAAPLLYRTAKRALRRIARAAGLADWKSIGLHTLRRTALTAAEEAARGDATALMRFARQTDMDVTFRYLPKVSQAVRDVSERYNRKLGRAAGVVVPLRP